MPKEVGLNEYADKVLAIVDLLIYRRDILAYPVPKDDLMSVFLASLYRRKDGRSQRIVSREDLQSIVGFSAWSKSFFDCQSEEEYDIKYVLMCSREVTLNDINQINNGNHPLLSIDTLRRMYRRQTRLQDELHSLERAHELVNSFYYDILRKKIDLYLSAIKDTDFCKLEKILLAIDIKYELYNIKKVGKYAFYRAELTKMAGRSEVIGLLKKIQPLNQHLDSTFKNDEAAICLDLLDIGNAQCLGDVLLNLLTSRDFGKISSALDIIENGPESCLALFIHKFKKFYNLSDLLDVPKIRTLMMMGRYVDDFKSQNVLKNILKDSIKVQFPNYAYGYHTPLVDTDRQGPGRSPFLVKLLRLNSRWAKRASAHDSKDFSVDVKGYDIHGFVKYVVTGPSSNRRRYVKHTYMNHPVAINELTLRNLLYRYCCYQLASGHNPGIALVMTSQESYVESRYACFDSVLVRVGSKADSAVNRVKHIAAYVRSFEDVERFDKKSFAQAIVPKLLMHFDPNAPSLLALNHEPKRDKIRFINMHDDGVVRRVDPHPSHVQEAVDVRSFDCQSVRPHTTVSGVRESLMFPLAWYARPEFFDEALALVATAREKSADLFNHWLSGMQPLLYSLDNTAMFQDSLSMARAVTSPDAKDLNDCRSYFEKRLAQRCQAMETLALELKWWHLFSIEQVLDRKQKVDAFLEKYPGFTLDYYTCGRNQYFVSKTLAALTDALPPHQRQSFTKTMIEARLDAHSPFFEIDAAFECPAAHLSAPDISFSTLQSYCDEYFDAKKQQSFAFFRRHSALFKEISQWLKGYDGHAILTAADRITLLKIIRQHTKKTTPDSLSYVPCLKIVNALYGLGKHESDDRIYKNLLEIPYADVDHTLHTHFCKETAMAQQALAQERTHRLLIQRHTLATPVVSVPVVPIDKPVLPPVLISSPEVKLPGLDVTITDTSKLTVDVIDVPAAKSGACLKQPDIVESRKLPRLSVNMLLLPFKKSAEVAPLSSPLAVDPKKEAKCPHSAPARMSNEAQPSFGKANYAYAMLENTYSAMILAMSRMAGMVRSHD